MSLIIKKKNASKGSCTHELYIEDLLVSDCVLLNKEGTFEVDSLSDGISLETFLILKGHDFPKDLRLWVYEFGNEHFFGISNISRVDDYMIFSFWTPYPKINKLPFKEKKFYQALRPILENEERITYEINEDFEDFENHFISTHVLLNGLDITIDIQVDKARSLLNSLLEKAIDDALSFNWKTDYDVNEKTFTQEVVIPLLNKLGFEGVHYNHGANEFGRDIIFSRTNEFNEKKYCAVQVKAGNLSGKVRGEIDEIIQQLDDAFSMPINLLNEPNDVYISEMIIATSGKLTENAKQKIRHKINKTIAGSLTFLDKESIMNHFLRINKTDNMRYE